MANLIDLLKGIKSKIGSNKVNVEPVQMAENGGIDMQATMELAQRQPKTPFERLFGRNIEIDTDTTNPTTGEITTERVAKFQPGLLNDLVSGAKENYTTGFAANNLQDDIGTEGQNKGLAYRIGEGAGTLGRGLKRAGGALGRFADTPLGRAAIMAGIVGATGGSGLQALAYGGTAGLGNQVNRMKDRAYRDSLINSAQQSRMGQNDWVGLSPDQKQAELNNIANQVNSYRGYIGDDVYGQMIQAQQLRDNAQYRNMLLNTQIKNQEVEIEQRKAEMARKAEQDRIDNYYKGQQIAQGWQKLENEQEKNNNANDGEVVMAQLDELMGLFGKLPQNYAGKGFQKSTAIATGLADKFGLRNDDLAGFTSVRNMMVNLVARKLAGEKGVMTDKDFARAETMVPSPYDSPQQAKSKYNAVKQLYYAGSSAKTNFTQPTQGANTNTSKSGVTKSGVKYEVIE